jgi:small subunit ribosomal protein S6
MNRYELTYIIDTVLEEDARKELVAKYAELIAQDGGEVEKIDETWGKRHLAYAINDMWEGWYVLVTFKAPAALPKELERNLQINDKILRYLIIKLEEKKQSVKPRPVRPVAIPVAPAAPEETAAPAEEAPAATEEAPKAEVAAEAPEEKGEPENE